MKPTANQRRFTVFPGQFLATQLLATLILLVPLTSPAAEPRGVSVSPLADLVSYPQRQAPATAVSLNTSRIASEIAGRVLEIPVQVGERLTKGAVLARLECGDYLQARRRIEAGIQGLQARRKLARFQLKRAESLARQDNVSQELLNQRQAEMGVLDAESREQEVALVLAVRNEAKCRITAPFDAIVEERLASVGEWRNVGEPLVRLLDMENIEISAQIQGPAVAGLLGAREPTFNTENQSFPLRVRTVLPMVNTRSRSREARLTFTTATALPGSAGRLLWQLKQPHLPARLLSRRDDQLGVFILDAQQARFVALPGALEGRPAPLDLDLQTLVIVAGQLGLRDGDAVSPAP